MSFRSMDPINQWVTSHATNAPKTALSQLIAACAGPLSVMQSIPTSYARQYALVRRLQYDSEGEVSDVTPGECQTVPDSVLTDAKAAIQQMQERIAQITPNFDSIHVVIDNPQVSVGAWEKQSTGGAKIAVTPTEGGIRLDTTNFATSLNTSRWYTGMVGASGTSGGFQTTALVGSTSADFNTSSSQLCISYPLAKVAIGNSAYHLNYVWCGSYYTATFKGFVLVDSNDNVVAKASQSNPTATYTLVPGVSSGHFRLATSYGSTATTSYFGINVKDGLSGSEWSRWKLNDIYPTVDAEYQVEADAPSYWQEVITAIDDSQSALDIIDAVLSE